MHTETAVQRDSAAELPSDTELTDAVQTFARSRGAVSLRLVLELRRRLKSTAEKELAIGADRVRELRAQLRRAETELRLCLRALEGRSGQLFQTGERIEKARARAAQTSGRLSSLDREHEDLDQQLATAQQDTSQLQESVRSEALTRNGTLDSFALATATLLSDLSQAINDQSSLRERSRNLMDQSELCAARARSLQTCFQSAHRAIAGLCGEMSAALDQLR